MNPVIDPWVITPRERAKYLEQFRALSPYNEMVTGAQAREFFLQSQLPPITLGEIWALADTDSDGKMNITEFSIACKLINLRLRSFEIPKMLPPILLASLSVNGGGTPTMISTGLEGLSPLDPLRAVSIGSAVPPNRPPLPPQPSIMQQQMRQQQIQPQYNITGLIHQQPNNIPPLIPGMSHPVPPLQEPLISTGGISYIPTFQPIAPQMNANAAIGSLDMLDKKLQSPVELAIGGSSGGGILPAPPTPPQSNTPNRAMSISDKVPSIESPGSSGQLEWAIKSQSKLKYTQMFNTTDRSRSGFLTGAQARNLMVQTKLPQSILAQIWALSDMDSDGRLGCEEFVLAMYLCEMAAQGDAIPAKLPPDLIPPSFRKGLSRHGSTAGSRQGSISSQGGAPAVDGGDPSAGLPSQTSFEDKRKENYDKGQAELERRRKVLLDIQRKEQEERERKEREEADKREKVRLEAERRQQEEMERQMQRQREIEQEKEEKRKREIEQKEAARKEMEKQRQLEWEKQRISEMQLQRQREQENVLKLKAQNQTYSIELSTLNEKIKELSQRICDTRASVTNVKTVIDGMRSTRDTQISEMSQLKSRIKEQNQKLVHLSQEKSKLDSKNKFSQQDANSAPDQAFTNKQILINQLKGKIDNTKQELVAKNADISTNTEQLSGLKSTLIDLVNTCEIMYSEYDIQRIQIQELKNNRKNESITSSWDTANTWASADESATPFATETEKFAASATSATDKSGYVTYRAIYEFVGRNADELSFQPGDIIMVPLEQNAEPGWFAGEINGHTGWFPETYVEHADTPYKTTLDAAEYEAPAEVIDNTSQQQETTPKDKNPVIEHVSSPTNTAYDAAESVTYVACYPYESTEVGDLVFAVGEHINVVKKDGDWWTGIIGDRSGIFPSNYVQELTTVSTTNDEQTVNDIYQASENMQNGNDVTTTISNDTHFQQPPQQIQVMMEEAKTLEDADTEVSEINTQPISDRVQETYSRPMSTSTTPGLRKQKGEVAQVIAAYEATSTEQLSLQRGQLIMIRKKTDSGWWEGELQARGRRRQIGWFPATYVKVLTSGRLSGRSTPVSGGKIQMNEAILDKVIALYPYKAQNDDELSFEKDDIISVMGRDEPEWWRGECQGLIGLFPSNYVGPFVTAGNA